MDFNIEQKDSETKGSFFIKDSEGKKIAEMTYSWAGTDRIIIDHTEVSEQLRGTGAGKALVYKSVDFAREKHISIIPLCPFARAVFKKEDAIKDVL